MRLAAKAAGQFATGSRDFGLVDAATRALEDSLRGLAMTQVVVDNLGAEFGRLHFIRSVHIAPPKVSDPSFPLFSGLRCTLRLLDLASAA
jgi:hypothetical protein